jgi:hypothetical protein
MMITRDASSENDVLYEFALGYKHPDPQRLDEFVRSHPDFADALTTLALELAIERTAESEIAASSELDPQAEVVLAKTMSHFQNRLYAIRSAQSSARPESAARQPRDLFSTRNREQMQALGTTLQVSQLFLRRLRDCEIRLDTMPPGFIREVAEAIQEPEVDVSGYFARSSPQLSRLELYKSSVKPTVGRQLTFEEAVRRSGLTSEQQARLLAL